MKMWGRNTSSNVQKAMWAVGELKLPCERIDVGGAYGKTKDPFYLAMNPNSLVPTLGGRRRLHAVGVEFGRALSFGQARRRRSSRRTPRRARKRISGWTGSSR